MKRIHALAVITLSLLAFAFIATVAATAYGPYLSTSRKGKILTWHFDTSDTTNGAFSGLDIDTTTVVAKWWDNQANIYTVVPYKTVVTETYVELYFYKQDLPKSAAGNSVAGTLLNGVDTFLASGPGWTFGSIH